MENDHTNHIRITGETKYRQQHETKGTLQSYLFNKKNLKFSVVH